MSTRVYLPPAPDLTQLMPLVPDVESVPAPLGASRQRRATPVSPGSMRTFVALVGAMSGCTAGVLTHQLLAGLGLQAAIAAPTLGFFTSAWGLSLGFLFQRLMDRARSGTIRVTIDGEAREFPLRRRHEVVRRASQYLVGLGFGFAISVGLGAYLLAQTVPTAPLDRLRLTPDLQACAVVVFGAAATLAFGEWTLRLTRKEGLEELGAFGQVPAMLALGLTLASFGI